MKLDLHEVIGVPGAHVSFEYGPELSDCSRDGEFEVLGAHAAGSVRNAAGALTLDGQLDADLRGFCARCLDPFEKHVTLHVTAALADSLQDEDNPDVYLLCG
ncbi:MAG: DUF177 domain-containing protein, partial [Oscillospiraceae bacterium]|nr:DUF177 domain-containing protein [Oscillospiraceae bacterium]